jgi:hypothetical protein
MLNKIKYTTLGFILGAILFMGLGFIYANSNAEEILAHFNNIKITVNGQQIETDVETPPFIYNDRTYVPLRFVSEALGADVNWDNKTKTVIINSKNNIKLEKNESFTEPENFIQMLPEDKPKQTVDGIAIYYFNEAEELVSNGMPYVNLSSVTKRYNDLSTEPNTNKGIDLYYKVILIKDLEIKSIDSNDRMTLEYYMNNIYPLTKGD